MPALCVWSAKKGQKLIILFKFTWPCSSGIGINQAGLCMWGSFSVDVLLKCGNKGVLSVNSLPRCRCCERGASTSWLSLIWAPQSQPISAATAGVHHFSLWPPPLRRLQSWSHPLTTPRGFTWPMVPLTTPLITPLPVNRTRSGAWHGASVLSVSFLKPVKVTLLRSFLAWRDHGLILLARSSVFLAHHYCSI